jgi:hypothetical protein
VYKSFFAALINNQNPPLLFHRSFMIKANNGCFVIIYFTLRHSRNQNNKFLKERVSHVDAKNQKKILEPE